MLSPLQLAQKTPLTNCGKCGHPACLAFATAVLRVGLDPTSCPFINLAGVDINTLHTASQNIQQGQKDLEFIAFLKDKIAAHNFANLAAKLKADFTSSPQPTLLFSYLGQEVVFSKKTVMLNGTEPEDHRDKILLYNYVGSGGGRIPTADWLGMESLPNAISKIKTLATYCEERLARLLRPDQPEKFRAIIRQLNGIEVQNSSASLAANIPVLPMLPQYLLFWEAEPEDNFPAKVKILFDKHVLDFLDLESLVFSAERLADRIELLWKER